MNRVLFSYASLCLGLGSGAFFDILDGIFGELFAVFRGCSALIHLLDELGGRQIGEGLATVKVLWHDGVRVRKSNQSVKSPDTFSRTLAT